MRFLWSLQLANIIRNSIKLVPSQNMQKISDLMQIWKLDNGDQIKSPFINSYGFKPKFWPKYIPIYMYKWGRARTRPKHCKNGQTRIEKSVKSGRSKSILEHDSFQKLDIALLLAISWSCSNQNQVLKPPKSCCKPSRIYPCTWKHNSSFLHLFAIFLVHSYSPFNFQHFCNIWFYFYGL